MKKIFAEKREVVGRKTQELREKGLIPAVLYGKSIDSVSLVVGTKNFLKTYKEVGLSSMAELNVGKEKYLVLIRDIQRDIISHQITHIDFYQPQLKEKTTINVPLVFEGEAPAVKEFSGTFVNNMKEIEIKAFPMDLPHDIKVDISGLKTLEDTITIDDLSLSNKLEATQDGQSIIASVSPPQDVDTELEKEIGDVEDVEVAEKGKKDDDEEE